MSSLKARKALRKVAFDWGKFWDENQGQLIGSAGAGLSMYGLARLFGANKGTAAALALPTAFAGWYGGKQLWDNPRADQRIQETNRKLESDLVQKDHADWSAKKEEQRRLAEQKKSDKAVRSSGLIPLSDKIGTKGQARINQQLLDKATKGAKEYQEEQRRLADAGVSSAEAAEKSRLDRERRLADLGATKAEDAYYDAIVDDELAADAEGDAAAAQYQAEQDKLRDALALRLSRGATTNIDDSFDDEPAIQAARRKGVARNNAYGRLQRWLSSNAGAASPYLLETLGKTDAETLLNKYPELAEELDAIAYQTPGHALEVETGKIGSYGGKNKLLATLAKMQNDAAQKHARDYAGVASQLDPYSASYYKNGSALKSQIDSEVAKLEMARRMKAVNDWNRLQQSGRFIPGRKEDFLKARTGVKLADRQRIAKEIFDRKQRELEALRQQLLARRSYYQGR